MREPSVSSTPVARLPETVTVWPVQAPLTTEPWMMSQYVPSDRPVVKVRVCADDSLLSEIHASGPRLPDESEWSPGAADDGPAPRQIALPVRQQDKRIVSTSSRKLLPFAPNWSSRV